MFFNRALFILSAGLSLVLNPQISAAKDYPIGTVFNDIAEFDFPGTRLKVPLPPGSWKLVSISIYRTNTSNVELRSHFLVRHDRYMVTGLMRIIVPTESVEYAWTTTRDCSEKRKRIAWYFHEDTYEKHEDCNVLYPSRGPRRSLKGWQKTFKYIRQSGLFMPRAFVGGRFTRSEREDYLRIGLWLTPEHYGFPRQGWYSRSSNPWNINNIDAFPKKKAFMEKARVWAKSWKGLVDKGFKNELLRAEVLAHPKIDGSFNRIPKKAPETIQHLTTTGSGAEAKLKKLKSLLEKKLITPEEYRAQRKKILDQL